MDGTGIFTGKIMGIITNNYNGIYCIMINYIIGCLEYGGGVEKGICEPKSAGWFDRSIGNSLRRLDSSYNHG